MPTSTANERPLERSAEVATTFSWADAVTESYALQAMGKRILCARGAPGDEGPWRRFSACQCCFHPQPISKTIGVRLLGDPNTGRGYLGGLQACASPWVCAVCSRTIWDHRKKEIAEGLEAHRAMGGGVLFITLTARHHHIPLNTLLQGMTAARRALYTGGTFTRLKKELGYLGAICATEITWSPGHGWHPHFHILWLVDHVSEEVVERIERHLQRAWPAALVNEGLSATVGAGILVKESSWCIEEYMAKIGHARSWDLDAEMTMGTRKRGRADRGYSAFDLLRGNVVATSAERSKRESLFIEYANATKGYHSLRWSAGLREKLRLGEVDEDEQAAQMHDAERQEGAEPEALIDFGLLPAKDWKVICANDCRAELRVAVGRCDVAHLTQFLRSLDIEWTPQTSSSSSNPQFGQVIPKPRPPTPAELAARGSPWPQPQPHTYAWYMAA